MHSTAVASLLLAFAAFVNSQVGPPGPPGSQTDDNIPKPSYTGNDAPPGSLGIPESELIYPELPTVPPSDLEGTGGELRDPTIHIYSDPMGPIGVMAPLRQSGYRPWEPPAYLRSRQSARAPVAPGAMGPSSMGSRVGAPGMAARAMGPPRMASRSKVLPRMASRSMGERNMGYRSFGYPRMRYRSYNPYQRFRPVY